MNEKKLLEAVGEVNDSYVEEAAGYRKSRKAPLWLRWGAVAACLWVAALGGSLLLRGGEGLTPDPAPVAPGHRREEWSVLAPSSTVHGHMERV